MTMVSIEPQTPLPNSRCVRTGNGPSVASSMNTIHMNMIEEYQ